jgi:hypothetical protein
VPIQGFDHDKCKQRNRVAAHKGLVAGPVRLYVKPPAGPEGYRMLTADGALPPDPETALAMINAMLGRDDDPLAARDVYLLYPEAVNTNFVSDRWMFIDVPTLKNVRAEAEEGFAFMNSHRTGGMSTPGELPYGRTFAGRLERWVDPDGNRFTRSLVGVYMLRGRRPNGESGPSTDDLFEGIKSGTIFDVSMGLYGGTTTCDVCGQDLNERDDVGMYLCPHAPGTTLEMTEDEIDAQAARGVPDGKATFTLRDAHAAEVSAVYDGAVPGAGFRKALALARKGRLGRDAIEQAKRAFAPLLSGGEFERGFKVEFSDRNFPSHSNSNSGSTPKGRTKARPGGPSASLRQKGTTMPKLTISAAEAFRFWKACGEPDEIDLDELRQELARDDDGANGGGGSAGGDGNEPPAMAPAPKPKPAARPAPQAALAGVQLPEFPADDPAGLQTLQLQIQTLQDQLKSEKQERDKDARENRRRAIEAEAKQFAQEEIFNHKRAAPSERANLISQYTSAAIDDAENPRQVSFVDPADNAAKTGSRVQALRAQQAFRVKRDFTTEKVAADAGARPTDRSLSTLYNGPEDQQDIGDVMYEAAKKYALKRNRASAKNRDQNNTNGRASA